VLISSLNRCASGGHPVGVKELRGPTNFALRQNLSETFRILLVSSARAPTTCVVPPCLLGAAILSVLQEVLLALLCLQPWESTLPGSTERVAGACFSAW
jgi:hypothetical protein